MRLDFVLFRFDQTRSESSYFIFTERSFPGDLFGFFHALRLAFGFDLADESGGGILRSGNRALCFGVGDLGIRAGFGQEPARQATRRAARNACSSWQTRRLRRKAARLRFIDVRLRLVVQLRFNDRSGRRGRGTIAIFRERLARKDEIVFTIGAACGRCRTRWARSAFGAAIIETAALLRAAIVASIVKAATRLVAATVEAARFVTARFVTSRFIPALIALGRSVLRRRKIASGAGSAWAALTWASTTTASTATSEASASAITTAIVAAAVAFTGASKSLAATIVSRAAIAATRRILLGRVVLMAEILRRRRV